MIHRRGRPIVVDKRKRSCRILFMLARTVRVEAASLHGTKLSFVVHPVGIGSEQSRGNFLLLISPAERPSN